MVAFLVRRAIHAFLVVLTAATLVFGVIHLSGDPLSGFVPPGASPEQRQRIRERFGLDRPLPVQYGSFLAHAARGDFGESWRARRPALRTVMERLPATLRLSSAALAITILLGLPLGLAAGTRSGGPVDALASGVALLGQAIPGFWLGTLLILVFAVRLRWLPASGGDGPRALVLPALALAAYPTAIVVRLLRSSLIETMGQDYIRTAAGKGLTRGAVVRGHALRNALLPTLAFVGLQAGFLIGGAVVVEGVFAYPGVGQLTLGAVTDRDLPVIQTFVIVAATLIVLLNLAVDAVARIVDPRLVRQTAASDRGA